MSNHRDRKIELFLIQWISTGSQYGQLKTRVDRAKLLREIQGSLLQQELFVTIPNILISIQLLENRFQKALDSYNLMKDFTTNPYEFRKSTEERFEHFFKVKTAMEPYF